LGPYVEATVKLLGKSFVKKGKEMLNAFEEDINVHGIGSIAELYDGNPSHKPHGCISSSVSVAEVIRGKYLLNKIKK
jgi:glycogen debranching enzyme